MFVIPAFVIAFGTAVAWSWLFLRRDKFQPEPRRLLVLLFVAGCVVTIPCALVEHFAPGNELTQAIVAAPVIEEAAKLACVFMICWSSRHFDQLIDGAIYAISCALGFAAVENLFYGLSGGFGTLGVRALVAPISHPLFTGIAGFYLARARFERNLWYLPKGFLLAALLHAAWNLGPGLADESDNPSYAVVFLAVALLYAWLLLRFLRRLGTADAQRLRSALALGTIAKPS